MIQPVQILIVEDDIVTAARLALLLSEMGYEVSGIVSRGEDALNYVKHNLPDIVLIDIQLKGELDGIDTALKMQEFHNNIGIIYLNANGGEANLKRAKATHPSGFVSRPFQKVEIQRSIELTTKNLTCNILPAYGADAQNSTFVLKDCLFIRHQDSMVKVDIKAVRYVEAERNYCRIFSTEKDYLLVSTLKEMDKKLPQKHFFRIHRSYIINLSRIDEISGTHVVISRKAIPMARGMRPELLKRLQTI